MPLTFTAAHSSRVSKSSKKRAAFDRSAVSSFARLARPQSGPGLSKPTSSISSSRGSSSTVKAEEDSEEDLYSEQLEDHGIVGSLSPQEPLLDVISTIRHVQETMFDPVPLERSGMSSARISEVLNFRQRLPALITCAHVHAIVQSPTAVEREIEKLVRKGAVRRIRIPGRGRGAKAIGEGIVLTEDWIAAITNRISNDGQSKQRPADANGGAALTEATAKKYIEFLKSASTDTNPLLESLSEAELMTLMRNGFVTASSAALRASTNIFSAARRGTAAAASKTAIERVARAASGSMDAVGGVGAVIESGGGLGGSSFRPKKVGGGHSVPGGSGATYDLRLTLPNTGAYLKLVEGARLALVAILEKTKYQEAPLYLLRDRWDGSVGTKAAYGLSKDPFAQVLPGKIRKWKEYFGVRFDWVLAECLGAGFVEVFETGSVGLGVRAI